MSETDAKAIKDRIDHHLFLAGCFESKIADLEDARKKHKEEAQRLSCELSKLQTTPLFNQ